MLMATVHTAGFLHITPVWDPQSIHAFFPRGTCLPWLWTGWFHLKCLSERGCVKYSQLSVKSYLALLINSLIPY